MHRPVRVVRRFSPAIAHDCGERFVVQLRLLALQLIGERFGVGDAGRLFFSRLRQHFSRGFQGVPRDVGIAARFVERPRRRYIGQARQPFNDACIRAAAVASAARSASIPCGACTSTVDVHAPRGIDALRAASAWPRACRPPMSGLRVCPMSRLLRRSTKRAATPRSRATRWRPREKC